MAIEKNSFGKMPDGTEVYKYTLTNKNGVSASFITLGGVWVSMVVPDKDGIMADVVLGYDDLDSYRRNPAHFGAPIGRNANRIGGAVITIDGKDYKLEANNGPNNLHSGPDLYHDRVWDCAALDRGRQQAGLLSGEPGRRPGISGQCQDHGELYPDRRGQSCAGLSYGLR